jgi:hypothetical protein
MGVVSELLFKPLLMTVWHKVENEQDYRGFKSLSRRVDDSDDSDGS